MISEVVDFPLPDSPSTTTVSLVDDRFTRTGGQTSQTSSAR